MKFSRNKTILITGGTGSFGYAAVKYLLKYCSLKKIIIFSRDENKQFEMQKSFKENKNIRFFLGDVRDKERLVMALKNVDFVIHAAAQKHVPAAEYNPFECIKTNVYGSQQVISASIERGVKKVVALSTDKACNPVNLYGATKLCSEKLFVNANQLAGPNETRFSLVRYGNVIASRGSVIPFFKELSRTKQTLPLTHNEMTRFFITLSDAVNFVIDSMNEMKGGEIFIPKMNSIYIRDIINTIDNKAKIKVTGLRAGEKIHEILCSQDETSLLHEQKKSYIIYPHYFFKNKQNKAKGKKVKSNFIYESKSKMCLDKKKIIQQIKKSKVLQK